jgi:2-hydroxy-6-oxonona-2,4-dienedioate hydrolase
MKNRKSSGCFAAAVGTAGALAGVCAYLRYRRDLRMARERVAAGRCIVQTACGPIECGEMGDAMAADSPPVLVIHGAGGGYDQAVLLGRLMVGEGYRIIAPSRFGYLGTPIPKDPSIAAQADAYACLLDTLQVDRVTVVAISAGGPSGLHFAIRYPERMVALVTVSAITFGGALEAKVHWDRTRANRAMESDLVYWLGITVLRFALWAVPGLFEKMRARLTLTERTGMEQILQAMLPLSDRLAGTRLDQARRLTSDAPLEQIKAPTLVIHARDDALVGFAHAEHAASRIPGAELMAFETGGHYLLGHYDAIEKRLTAFLREVAV